MAAFSPAKKARPAGKLVEAGKKKSSEQGTERLAKQKANLEKRGAAVKEKAEVRKKKTEEMRAKRGETQKAQLEKRAANKKSSTKPEPRPRIPKGEVPSNKVPSKKPTTRPGAGIIEKRAPNKKASVKQTASPAGKGRVQTGTSAGPAPTAPIMPSPTYALSM